PLSTKANSIHQERTKDMHNARWPVVQAIGLVAAVVARSGSCDQTRALFSEMPPAYELDHPILHGHDSPESLSNSLNLPTTDSLLKSSSSTPSSFRIVRRIAEISPGWMGRPAMALQSSMNCRHIALASGVSSMTVPGVNSTSSPPFFGSLLCS